MHLPPHAAFKVAKTFDKEGGITSPEASVRYGPTTRTPMLRLRDATTLFVDRRLLETYADKVEPVRPTHTLSKQITLTVPLGDVLVKDGKQTYVRIQEGDLTELIQVDNKLLIPENLRKAKQIIKAEWNWKTTGKDSEYVTCMLEGNDQMTIDIPKMGSRKFSNILPLLFNEKELKNGNLVKKWLNEFGNLVAYLLYEDTKVAGGLGAAAGHNSDDWDDAIVLPSRLSSLSGALIYTAAGAKKYSKQATKKTPENLAIATPEMTIAVQTAQKRIAQLEGTLAKTAEAIADLKTSIGKISSNLQW